jgi:UDP-N-acetyl-2-amino-2-deoxyglucuronate dehydrogenase
MSSVAEPPVNDLWTVPGEEALLPKWKEEDERLFRSVDSTSCYHRLQIADFLQAVLGNREPAVTGEEGRRTVELFTAVYRSQRDHAPVQFPLPPDRGPTSLDGRPEGRAGG